MASQETLDVVILGASFAGLSVAHSLLNDIFPHLRTFDGAPCYRAVLVAPSSHLYWNIAAPRALVSPALVPFEDLFSLVTQGFEHYSPEEFIFIQGAARLIDTATRQVTITLTSKPAVDLGKPISSTLPSGRTAARSKGSAIKTLTYHALIFATGSSADSPLLSLHGPHENTLAALDEFHKRLRTANSIVVVGGGPSGVETAGQLAVYFNSPSPKPLLARLGIRKAPDPLASDPPRRPKTITLLSGHDRLLPNLAAKYGQKAEQQLRRNHVHILHNTRLVAAAAAVDVDVSAPSGQTACHLNNDTTITADLHIACTGVKPNTSFLPPSLLNATGHIRTHSSSLRVDQAGPRVFALGDCAAYSTNRTADVFAALPVLAHNLRNDLRAHQLRLLYPPAGQGTGLADALEALVDRRFEGAEHCAKETVLVPCAKHGGVGVWEGLGVPSVVVHWLKGMDYRVGKVRGVVERGDNPYGN